MKNRDRGKSALKAHAIYKRSVKTKRETRREDKASESGSSRETRLRLFRRVRRERKTSDVSVHARSTVRGRGGCSSCWAGCRERSHHPGGADGRAEKGRTRRCAMSEGDGEEWDRRRGERRGGRGGGRGGEGKGGGKGTAPPGWRGGEREGGQTG